MQDVKTALEDFGIDETEILQLIEADQLLDAVRIFEQKTPLNLQTIMSLLGAIKNGEKHFIFNPEVINTSQKVTYENIEGEITVRLTEVNGSEKIVYPTDRDWTKVKKALGHLPEIIEYETAFKDQVTNRAKKSTLFIEENKFAKGKFIIIIIMAAVLALAYFIYQNF